MKRILSTLAVALLLVCVTAPSDARPSRPRPGPLGLPTLVVPAMPANPPFSAYTLLHARLVAKRQQAHVRHPNKKHDRKAKPLSRPGKMPLRGFDWTMLGIATRIRDQGQAGTCWAHAGVEALEASVEILSDTFPLLAVQPILDQLQHSQGGDACMVFPELKNKGTGLTQDYPYLVGKLNPRPKKPLPYKGRVWGYVNKEDGQATVAQIKMGLLQYGPLYTTLYASTPGFMRNRGQVMAEKGPMDDVNHAVLIVGWDDARKAWKIKNSWGPRWGDRGFGWVAFGHYRIGTNTAWVQAQVEP